MTEETTDPRGSICAHALIAALQDHVVNGKKMTATQVSAAIALLKKILPDIPAALSKPEDKPPKTHEEALQELE